MTNPFDSNRDPSSDQHGGNNGPNSSGTYGSGNEASNGGNTYGSYGSDQSSFGNNGYGGTSYGENSYGASQGMYGQEYQDPNGYGQGYQQQDGYGAGYQQQGGYGAGYQQQGGLTVSPVDAMDSIGQAFKGYFKQPMPGALAVLTYYAIVALGAFLLIMVLSLGAASTSATSYDPATDTFSDGGAAGLGALSILAMVVVYLLMILLNAWMYAGCVSASCKIANGQNVSFGDYFKGGNVKGIFGVHICYIIAVIIGTFTIVLGIVAAVLFWAAPVIKAEDPEKSIGECFKESKNLVVNNFGQMFLFYLVFTILVNLFMLIPIVGILCAPPLMSLGHVLFLRTVRKRPAMRWA
ncbi:hypothetical protein I6J72_05220 [Corynebacterium sp. FDAARGOS 1242]|uniref:hypothetical protein n=1 Tax=Corynebacterium sp. FDAARGOS 1242 TaxID=2778078 RepID=UPI001950D4BE|nr:hypothetical protein [Corynebacterium sp. FDAARGOS 1242]QRP98906.1 hypothetical protein I6J72_05220 [Corynebacterium sp. FDAARGOS 1242]